MAKIEEFDEIEEFDDPQAQAQDDLILQDANVRRFGNDPRVSGVFGGGRRQITGQDVLNTRDAIEADLVSGGIGLQEGFKDLGNVGWSILQAANEPIIETGPLSLTLSGPRPTGLARSIAGFSREAAKEASSGLPELQELREETGGSPTLGSLSRTAVNLAPVVAAGPLGAPAAIGAAGAQGGASTLSQAQDVFEQDPEPREGAFIPNPAFRSALAPAALDAAQTAALTAVFGRLFGAGAEGLSLPSKIGLFKNSAMRRLGETVGEVGEEVSNQIVSDAIAAASYNPELTFEQAVDNATKTVIPSAILGGGVPALQGLSSESKSSGQAETPIREFPAEGSSDSLSVAEAPKEVTLGDVSAMPSERFFEESQGWAQDAMRPEGGIGGQQVRAELAAIRNPDIEAWKSGEQSAIKELEAIQNELRENPQLMQDPAFQKRFTGAAMKKQFATEGREVLDGTKQPSPQTIGNLAGARFVKEVSTPKRKLWMFEDSKTKGSFSVPEGSTLDQVKQRASEKRGEFQEAASVADDSTFVIESEFPPLPHEETVKLAEQFNKEFPGAPKLNIAKDYHGLPDAAHRTAYKVGTSPQLIKAFVSKDGEIWINASEIKSPDDLRALASHEAIGHFATDKIHGPKLRKLMEQVHDSWENDRLMKIIKRNYPNGDKFLHGREYIAHLAENPKANPTAWSKIVAQFREWLREIGWVKKVSENDIRVMLQKAADSLRKRQEGGADSEGSLSTSDSGRDPEYDATMDYAERYDKQADNLISQIEGSKKGERVRWDRVSAPRLKKIWLDFGRSKVIRDEKGLQRIADSVMDGIARLKAATDLMGHSRVDPAEVAEALGREWTEETSNKATEFMVDERGNWTLSDFALNPLERLYGELHRAETPEQQLYAIDKILNVVHQRSDLAALFVEGGSKTLSEIANQGGYVSPEGSLSVKDPDDLESTPLDPQSGTPISQLAALGGQRQEPRPAGFTTSNKNEVVDSDRKRRGLPPMMSVARQSNQAAWDSAMRKIDNDPRIQDSLIEELTQQPRALTTEENALLLHRRVELNNDYEKALRSWRDAFESGDMVKAGEESLKAKGLSNQISDLDDVTKATGAESGRSLQARKMMADEDYSLAKMEMAAMEAKGRSLTEEEHVELIKAHDKIAGLQRRIEELESTREAREVETETDSEMKSVERDAKSKDFDVDREEKLLAGIKAKFEKGEQTDITPLVQKLARVFWLRGIRTRDGMLSALHSTLNLIDPSFTLDQTKRAFSGYGQFKPISKEEIDVGLRDLRGQTQQVLKMEAIESRKPIEKTGVERRVPSDEERRLIKQVNELKRKYGVVVTDPATQLKSALQSRKTYYEHRIADLKHEIETRERIVKTKSPSPTDPELESLIEEYERIKSEHDQIFPRRQMTDEQRLKQAIAAAQRNQAHWQVRLENAERGIFDIRQPRREITSPELELIKAENAAIREHVKELKDLATPKKTPEERALQALKSRMTTQAAKLRERIAKGDFGKKTKTPTKLDEEGNRIKAELDAAREEFNNRVEQDRWEKMTPFQKGKRKAADLYDAARALMTTGELSFILRQGKFFALSHPVRTAKALPDMFRALLSNDQRANEINLKTLNDPEADAARQAKLHLPSDATSRLSKQEEINMGRWVGKIPVVKNFNHAATVFLNRLRLDSFKALRKAISKNGTPTPEEDRQIAMFVNEATGRGGLGKLEAAAVPLARIMFSPRYFASRLQMAAGHSLWGGTMRTRRAIATEYARSLAGLGIYYMLLKGMLGDDEKEATIEGDPRSSDFGKVKVGNTRVDPLAGLAQVITLASRTATGEKKTLSGKVQPIRGKVPYGGEQWSDIIARYARGKLHPVPSSIANLFDGTDLGGDEATILNQAGNMVAPITYMDIYAALREQGLEDGAAMALLGLLGEGLQTYEKKKPKQ